MVALCGQRAGDLPVDVQLAVGDVAAQVRGGAGAHVDALQLGLGAPAPAPRRLQPSQPGFQRGEVVGVEGGEVAVGAGGGGEDVGEGGGAAVV